MKGALPDVDGCLCFALIDNNRIDRVMRVLAMGDDLIALRRVEKAL